jgi:hypothetical protein
LGMMEAFHHEERPVDGVMRLIEQGAGHRKAVKSGIWRKFVGPRSWRRLPQRPIGETKAPKDRRNRAFEDSYCHPEWPTVADTAIEACLCIAIRKRACRFIASDCGCVQVEYTSRLWWPDSRSGMPTSTAGSKPV